MARRGKTKKKNGTGGVAVTLIVGMALAVGLSAGYAWRSFAPLPLPGPPELSGEATEPAAEKATNREIRRLQAKLDEIGQLQEQTEEDLAEIQIKSILEEN